jgi:hypothetical protein
VADVVPISQPHAIAAGLRYKAVAIARAASAVTALIRRPAQAPGADPAPDLWLPSRFTGTFLRQPPITRGAAVTLEDSSRNTCVGVGEPSRDTLVSLAACDLYNASRKAGATELLGWCEPQRQNHLPLRRLRARAGRHHDRLKIPDDPHLARRRSLPRSQSPPLSRMHENPLPVGRTTDRNHFAGRLLRGIGVAGGARLNLDPGPYILDRGNFAVSGKSTVNGTGVTSF